MSYKELIGDFDIVVRSIVSVTILFILTRIMGKKQIAQLTFFDYVIGISIGSIAADFAIDETISYLHGVIGLIVYSLFPIIVYYITLKSIKLRNLLDGTPTVIIQNGKLLEGNMKKCKVHVNDVLEECRLKGAFSITDVEFAILETGGKVSILLKSPKQPLTPENMNIQTSYKGICADLIIDGTIMYQHLILVNRDEKWLLDELKKQNVKSKNQVLLATLDTSGKLNIDLKNHDPIPFDVLK